MIANRIWEYLRERGVLENRFSRDLWGDWLWDASESEMEVVWGLMIGKWN